ncbi:unnamed protein product [Rotaria socialis]|uniref:Eukaryotic translation initiation factor 5 n=1 Tax=Rotaria socialis TaxID=392032 RepID=A0A817URR0_9BILA|nr:unnamed protein product [Rotaria socialis]
MTMINIDRRKLDPFDRYTMHRLVVEVECRRNCMKTILINLSAIAKDVYRPPIYLAQFICYKLSAPVKQNKKQDRYFVNGTHDCEKLQNFIYDFIDRYVICSKCDNPETKLSVNKDQQGDVAVHQSCNACGHSRTMDRKADRLTQYIARHLLNAKAKGEASSGIKKTNRSKSKKHIDPVNATESIGEANGISTSTYSGDDSSSPIDDDWSDDSDLDKQLAERCDQYGRLVEKKKTDQKLNDIETVRDLLAEAERLEIMEQAPFIVGQCVFTENILKDIDDYKLLFTKLCTKNAKGQKYLLHAIEALIGEHEEIRKKIFNKKTMSKILLKFYDEDIIEEDTFYTWHEKASKRFTDKNTAKEIREMANEFVQWLRTAEESSDEEDDDDDNKLPEPQISFTHTVNKPPVKGNGEIIDTENI